eukprot:TRINITY_DN43962_c0_g1_i1.p1 TRINITY_DN43962_c0_g1~~TRINITY_DN43962_c0_g1_i1.p1  ORF type:complete len:147 (+),score=12.62 TRINITY_DN43962_c0_g1_i1:34-441(+)
MSGEQPKIDPKALEGMLGGSDKVRMLYEAKELIDSNKEASRNAERTEGKCKWTQEEDSLTVHIPLPEGTTKKDVVVNVKRTNISVGVKGSDPILCGELAHECSTDETMWVLEDGPAIQLEIAKEVADWWPSVLKH